MFQELQPLLAERKVHLMLSQQADGRLAIYVEPCKRDDKEDDAFVTPFRAVASAAELDEQLPSILEQWISRRHAAVTTLAQSLAEAEAAQEAAAAAAKAKVAEKGKKPTITPSAGKVTPQKATTKVEAAKPHTPSLLDAPVTPVASETAHPAAPTSTVSVVTAPTAPPVAAIASEDSPEDDLTGDTLETETSVSAPPEPEAAAPQIAPTIACETGTISLF